MLAMTSEDFHLAVHGEMRPCHGHDRHRQAPSQSGRPRAHSMGADVGVLTGANVPRRARVLVAQFVNGARSRENLGPMMESLMAPGGRAWTEMWPAYEAMSVE